MRQKEIQTKAEEREAAENDKKKNAIVPLRRLAPTDAPDPPIVKMAGALVATMTFPRVSGASHYKILNMTTGKYTDVMESPVTLIDLQPETEYSFCLIVGMGKRQSSPSVPTPVFRTPARGQPSIPFPCATKSKQAMESRKRVADAKPPLSILFVDEPADVSELQAELAQLKAKAEESEALQRENELLKRQLAKYEKDQEQREQAEAGDEAVAGEAEAEPAVTEADAEDTGDAEQSAEDALEAVMNDDDTAE